MSAPVQELAPREAAAELVAAHADDTAWLDAFAESFERRRVGRELDRILDVWGLSQTALGALFGVSRQAVAKWRDQGVPADRVEALAELSAATDLLVHYLKRDRIPAVVRREAAALGGRSLLDLLSTGGAGDVLAATRDMFAFGDAHR